MSDLVERRAALRVEDDVCGRIRALLGTVHYQQQREFCCEHW